MRVRKGLILLAALSGCVAGAPVQTAASPTHAREVVINNYAFHPMLLRVPVGTTVQWVNRDIASHTVTGRSSSDEPFDSGQMAHDQVFTHTFPAPGTYAYMCVPHSGMQGTIIVE